MYKQNSLEEETYKTIVKDLLNHLSDEKLKSIRFCSKKSTDLSRSVLRFRPTKIYYYLIILTIVHRESYCIFHQRKYQELGVSFHYQLIIVKRNLDSVISLQLMHHLYHQNKKTQSLSVYCS